MHLLVTDSERMVQLLDAASAAFLPRALPHLGGGGWRVGVEGRGWLLELPFRNEGLGVGVGGRGWRYGLWVEGGRGG